MTKAELLNELASQTGESKATCERVLDALVLNVHRGVGKGLAVTVTGLGVFSRAHREARTGRNPRTGAEVPIAARYVPKFRAAKAFKDAIPQPKSKARGKK